MSRIVERARRLRRSEGGWTLVEMLVAVTIGMVVLGGAVTIFMGAVKSEPRATAKVSAIQEGRVALERITREVRQGVEVEPGATGSELVLVTYVRSGSCGSSPGGEAEPCKITYDCAEDQCSRAVAEPNGGSPGATVPVVTDLSTTANVFTYVPNAESPEYVGVELSFEKSQSTDPTVLADGATLRSGDSS